jgi:KamA family protein
LISNASDIVVGYGRGKRAGKRAKFVRGLDEIPQLSNEEKKRLQVVAERYPFRANDYYLGLINWEDPEDPIRRLVIPHEGELNDWGQLDASNERAVTVAHGVQHKYSDTVLLLCNEVCGSYCRYCFRKRLFMEGNDESSHDVSEGLRYIADHPELNNVLLTGGDPLLMSVRRLREIIAALRRIPHVRIIRIGSKMPAFDPMRLMANEALLTTLREFSTPQRRIYLMTHFDHPRELTRQAIRCLDRFLRNGVICANQCPLIKGINDHPGVLAKLFRKLSFIGCPPYYLFQGRPTQGNEPYEVPLVRGYQIFREAMTQGSGLARRARFCMSHERGKIQILHVDERHIYLHFHQAKDPADLGRFFICRRDDDAFWFDQLELVSDERA